MSSVVLLARVGLALVFGVAAIAKFADVPGSRQALRDFGVPPLLATPFGVLLPLVELVVALALLPAISAWWAGVFALGLLLLFVAGISYNLLQRRSPDCHCFGQLHSAPIGKATLLRNGGLIVLALVVVLPGRTSPGLDLFAWIGQLEPGLRVQIFGDIVVLAVLLGMSWLLWHILQQQGRLLLRIEALEAGNPTNHIAEAGLPVGSTAPAFTLAQVAGERVQLADLLAQKKAVLLFFADPACGPCSALFPEIGRWQRDHAEKLTLAVISRGSEEENRRKVVAHGIENVLLQTDREVQAAYQVTGTPTPVLIRPDGTIGSKLAQGAEVIRSLVGSAAGLSALRTLPMAAVPSHPNGHGGQSRLPQLSIGEPAPDFSLPDLEGERVTLSDFRGSPTIVLFWRPGCGFCQRMLEDLTAWEAEEGGRACRLLVVSSESVENNRAMGLHSMVVLDQAGMRVGAHFGATGTPMAILVDEHGKIASDLAAGASDVLSLLRSTSTSRTA